MRPNWVALGLGIAAPSALLSYHLKTSTWTEVVGYTTYTHQFSPVLWVGAAVISIIGFGIIFLGIVLADRRSGRRRTANSVCPQCGTPGKSRFCQNCGARFD